MNKTFTCQFYSALLFILISALPLTSFSQQRSTLDIALDYLLEKQEELRLTDTDISNYRVSDHYTSRHNGVTHLYLQQLYADIPVQNALININILPDGKVLNMGNRFVSHLANKINTTTPSISATEALQVTLAKFAAPKVSELRIKETRSEHHFIFDHKDIALEAIPVQLKYELQSTGNVQLVWNVKYYQLDAQHRWNVKVDAVKGTVLSFHDDVIHCNFDHPDASCHEAHGTPLNEKMDFSLPVNIPLQENLSPVMANTYHVFPIPIESPNHGNRAMVTDPADPVASPFGWHDTDGVSGEEYTITRGNNVHAYHDIFAQNDAIGGEPDGGTTLEFDFPFDIANDTVYQHLDAATVNLFYWNNVVHDLWYQYGFDEESGNFQTNNYGNGGMANDYVRAEAVDGSGFNNANFFTPDDGSRPRMQMFIWNGSNTQPQPNRLIVTDTAGETSQFLMLPASFGSGLPETPVVSEMVEVDDGQGNTLDACDPIQNGDELAGKIALIERSGSCNFGTQALRAQLKGATGVVICQNNNGNIFSMPGGDDGVDVNIPVVMIAQQVCDVIRADIDILTVSLGAPDYTIPSPGPRGLDSDFDNGVIVHEYGHGISNRLTGGPSASNCLRNQEQAGEGWSDWFGLVMTTTSANTPEESRGIGTYLLEEMPGDVGIRNFPYSRDMNVYPYTYSNINDNDVTVPHGVGSIFAVTIWDLYWNMVDIYGFDDDLYNGTGGNNMTMQLVLDGLKLQACSPTFLDSRDAILAADIANFDGAHQCIIWETFARRGIGVNAKAGGSENFEIPFDCQRTLKIKKTANAEVMAGETLTYQIEVINGSPDDLTEVVVTDPLPEGIELITNSVSCNNFEFNNNVLTILLEDMASGDTAVCTFDVLVASTPFSFLSFEDDVEDGVADWQVNASIGSLLWTVGDDSFDGENAWFAFGRAEDSDQRLTTANSFEILGENATLSFWHRYDTEQGWDGGVVEISIDGGVTWEDLRFNFIQNGYPSILINPILQGQLGFTGDSDGYLETIADLSEFQGENVIFRFRFTTNDVGDSNGWFVDNIKLYGDFRAIDNQACVSSSLNENACGNANTVVFGEPTTSVKQVENNIGVSIFPNPTEGQIFIKVASPSNEAAQFNLTSIDGRSMVSKKVVYSNGLFDMDLSGLPQGIYFLQIQTKDAFVIRKVIIE